MNKLDRKNTPWTPAARTGACEVNALFIAALMACTSAQANSRGTFDIPLPAVASGAAATMVKFDGEENKILLGFIGADARQSVVYDIATKNVQTTCMAATPGTLVWLSGDGAQFAVRVTRKQRQRYAYEVRTTRDCRLKSTLPQPPLLYAELMPQVAFSPALNRAVLVEMRNPYSSGKAMYAREKELRAAGFSTAYGRVHILALNSGVPVKRLPTPAEDTQLHLSADGKKIVMVQPSDDKKMMVLSMATGAAIDAKKDSALYYLAQHADNSWQSRVNFLTFAALYPTPDSDIPDVDEEREEMTFHTAKGSLRLTDFAPPSENRFWLSVGNGRYMVVAQWKARQHVVTVYPMNP